MDWCICVRERFPYESLRSLEIYTRFVILSVLSTGSRMVAYRCHRETMWLRVAQGPGKFRCSVTLSAPPPRTIYFLTPTYTTYSLRGLHVTFIHKIQCETNLEKLTTSGLCTWKNDRGELYAVYSVESTKMLPDLVSRLPFPGERINCWPVRTHYSC